MKCEIIKDLLPMYVDNLCSQETKEEMEKHTTICTHCNDLLKEMQADIEVNKEENLADCKMLLKMFNRGKITAIITAFICTILFCIFQTCIYVSANSDALNFLAPYTPKAILMKK